MNRKRKLIGSSGTFKRQRKSIVESLATFTFGSTPEILQNSNEINTTDELGNLQSGVQEVSESEPTSSVQDDHSYCENINNKVSIEVQEENERLFSRDFPFDYDQFKSELASWAVQNRLKHDQLRGLLQIWNERVPLTALPIDPRTLLETPRNIKLSNQSYWHYGLKKSLRKMLQGFQNVPELLSLQINTDGIPLSKSSQIECWPILYAVKELPKLSPGIIGVYCDSSKKTANFFSFYMYKYIYSTLFIAEKPQSMEAYLRQFVDELLDCIKNGVDVNGKHVSIKIFCFTCDSPARAMIKSMNIF